jgi:FlaA1/EpsC-like NDP-sugar epimerase
LHRDPVRLNLEEIARYLNDKVVLVTGAGGSIGSELCRQICRFRPRQLILLENSENNLYEIDLELGDQHPGINLVPCLADIKDAAKINLVFDTYRPQVVFHAAAHKHVPMMEHNPDEAVKNNVIGTRIVAEAADRFGAETFILISTDKAVNPTSVMGATKRIAEMVIQHVGKNSQTRFAAVRFGNVLGSRGSVVPLFKKQIARGGPVTVTHPEMKRYFMTIPEAVQLVIQAGALARGGEIFVLDMGEPVKIVDLARDLIRLSGLRPDEDIEIRFKGVRPGEKLFEELLTTEEGTDATAHERIFIAHANGIDLDKVENILFNKLQRGINLGKKEVIAMLKEMVPEFQRSERSRIG